MASFLCQHLSIWGLFQSNIEKCKFAWLPTNIRIHRNPQTIFKLVIFPIICPKVDTTSCRYFLHFPHWMLWDTPYSWVPRERPSCLTTGLTHAKLVSLTSPCCSGWPAPMNNPQGQQRELSSDGCADFNAWLESDLVLIINFNSTHKYHMNPHTWHMIYITCYFLIIGTDIKFNHTNSPIHSPGHSHSLFTSASDYASAQWRLALHILVTYSPHVNKCWFFYSLWLTSLTHNHSTSAGPVRIHCVMTGVFGRKWKGCASVPKHWGFFKWT